MFKLHLDMKLYFDPPMADSGRGICVTREFDLPFPPTDDLFLTSVALNGIGSALGYRLDQVTWDVDREVFLADSSSSSVGFPIALIPLEIRDWIDRGWKLGSYEDFYEKPDGRATRFKKEPITYKWKSKDEDTAEKWHQMKPRERPESFNQFFKAIIREMAVLDNNTSVAYAMYRTQMYFDEKELQKNELPPAKKFRDAKVTYEQMTYEEMAAWSRSVIRRYPRLEQFVRGFR